VVPVIRDEYVAMDFGTGCLKITPAHDENDYEIGRKHDLELVDIFNADGTLNQYGLHYEGMDRFEARKAIVSELEEKGYLVKKEPYIHKVGTSERTKAVIEPRLSDQWFLKMKELAEPALRAVLETGEVQLVPSKFDNTYRHWMENIRDWNISRQLWWGQRIPAYYYGPGKEDMVVAETPEKALEMARDKSGRPDLATGNLRQDEDVLDTWFSSWLWPISVFGGILDPDNEEVSYYYPTSDLVTAPDILFFWVARMIMAGYHFRGERPFEKVYLTGLVRDKQRRKMSKSLGNSPDALKLIEEYGADGVRVGLLLSSAAGNDLLFDEVLCQQGKNFANKIWNAFRLVMGWEVDAKAAQPEAARLGILWYEARYQETLAEIEDQYSKYRISDALMATYKLIWDDFCSWLLEIAKPAYGEPVDEVTYRAIIRIFEENLKLLHPFMPFLTEEVWQHMSERTADSALIVSDWPEKKAFDPTLLKGFEFTKEVISGIRTIRKEKSIPFREVLALHVIDEEGVDRNWDVLIRKLANTSGITYSSESPEGALSFRVKSNEYFVPLAGAVDLEAEIRKIEEELDYTRGFLASVQKKLSNQRFVENAPQQVVDMERKKAADAESKIETLEKSLANYR
jgi:valyl-tRNA synthetase